MTTLWPSQRVHRHALVIGNSDYARMGPLPNAERDATLVAEHLRAVGTKVDLHTNLDSEHMKGATESFIARLRQADGVDTIVFYFAGHGCQEASTNFLLPVGDFDGGYNALPLQQFIQEISPLSTRRLIFLDACRSNLDSDQVESELTRSRGLDPSDRPTIRRGLSEFDADDDTFISFSAAPGQPALDGIADRPNSPYAEAMSRFINEVDLPLTVMMSRVRNSVLHDTEGTQRTWDSSSLKTSFFFNPSSLLFLVGNALALVATFVALGILSFALMEAAIADFAGNTTHWTWFHISVAVFAIAITVFLYGVWRAYARVRGEVSEWQTDGTFRLLKWSSAGSFGAMGGILGGIISPTIVTVPYWYTWWTAPPVPWISCDFYHWADPHVSHLCPKLGQLLVEGSVAGIFIFVLLGLLTMHVSEWMVRRESARSVGQKRISFFNLPIHRDRALTLTGALLGGGIAGVVIGPCVTAYFGSHDRPFLQPGFVAIWALLAVAVMSFCIVNYRLETFTFTRLMRSILGAVVGTLCALVFLSAELGVLYATGFIESVLSWANTGFYDENKLIWERYGFLLIAGLPYGLVFGLGFGVLIGVTRIASERDA